MTGNSNDLHEYGSIRIAFFPSIPFIRSLPVLSISDKQILLNFLVHAQLIWTLSLCHPGLVHSLTSIFFQTSKTAPTKIDAVFSHSKPMPMRAPSSLRWRQEQAIDLPCYHAQIVSQACLSIQQTMPQPFNRLSQKLTLHVHNPVGSAPAILDVFRHTPRGRNVKTSFISSFFPSRIHRQGKG